MPKKKKPGRDRVDLRMEPDLIERASKRAAELGINLSAYIRLVISTELERVAKERPPGK